jgi:hypothetical protein
MKIIKTTLISLCFFFPMYLSGQTCKIYVDANRGSDINSGKTVTRAVKTLQRANAIIRTATRNNTTSIAVYLRRGNYTLSQPLQIDNIEGKAHNILITAYQHEQPMISGGYTVQGWQIFNRQKGIYAAKLPHAMMSRQLYVNGERAIRARESDTPCRWIKSDDKGHITSDLTLLKFKNPKQIECVYREIWTAPRCGIDSIYQTGDTLIRINMKQPGWMNCRNKGITSARTPWYIENAYELLDSPGEWYLDTTGAIGGTPYTLYYKPRAWENMDRAEFVMPVAETLIKLKGSAAHKLTNVKITGLTFQYTTWLRPSTNRGNPDAQNNVMRENKSGDGELLATTAAISMYQTQGITIDNCRFMHLGGDGINLLAGCSYNTVSNNIFYDISATGIQLGGYKNWQKQESENSYDPIDKRNLLTGNSIIGNHIQECGVEYRSATGIASAFAVDDVFRGNTVRDMPYSGFHIGWAWTTVPHTAAGGNIITRNWIQNVMVELADGGSIYTLGGSNPDKPNTITRNYMNRVMWGQGVYMDNGSSYYNIKDNVFNNIGDCNVKINSGSHDIHVTGIYSNKNRNLWIKDKCPGCSIDSTHIYNVGNTKVVDAIRKEAGAKMGFLSVWELLPDIHRLELECAETSGNAYTTAGIGTKVYDYSGMGFISGFEHGGKSSVGFKYLTSKAGIYTLDLRYSAGTGWNNNMIMTVNGKDYPLTLQTTQRGKWTDVKQSAPLRDGMNEITIHNNGESSDFLFLDDLQIYQ